MDEVTSAIVNGVTDNRSNGRKGRRGRTEKLRKDDWGNYGNRGEGSNEGIKEGKSTKEGRS